MVSGCITTGTFKPLCIPHCRVADTALHKFREEVFVVRQTFAIRHDLRPILTGATAKMTTQMMDDTTFC